MVNLAGRRDKALKTGTVPDKWERMVILAIVEAFWWRPSSTIPWFNFYFCHLVVS